MIIKKLSLRHIIYKIYYLYINYKILVYFNNINKIIISNINNMFNNDFVRLFSLILAGIYAGYTLQPVPKWLNMLFDKSQLFKFIIIMIIGITAVYPIDNNKLINITLSATIVLMLFEFFRKYD
jgi:hypothetical protein